MSTVTNIANTTLLLLSQHFSNLPCVLCSKNLCYRFYLKINILESGPPHSFSTRSLNTMQIIYKTFPPTPCLYRLQKNILKKPRPSARETFPSVLILKGQTYGLYFPYMFFKVPQSIDSVGPYQFCMVLVKCLQSAIVISMWIYKFTCHQE